MFQYADPSLGSNYAIRERNWRNLELINLIKKHSDYTIFTFCRNPLDRMVSIWKFLFGDQTFEQAVVLCEDFLKQNPEEIYARTPNNDTNLTVELLKELDYPFKDGGNIGYHLLPQSHFVRHVNFLGKVETIQEDYDKLCYKIEIPRTLLPQKMRTTHKPYHEYYNDELREKVENLYSKDMSIWKESCLEDTLKLKLDMGEPMYRLRYE
tara:strand:+ start:1271 stop:1897 length:627 start_codon:yes stop_codon:yes gene_type:complete